MKCPYCDTEFDMETLQGFDEDIKDEGDNTIDWQGMDGSAASEEETDGLISYVCNSCGGEIVADTNTAATSCPYCGNPAIVPGKVSGMLRPDLVVPFKLDKKAAKEAYLSFIKGKKLLPKTFADQNHIDEIKGMYVPFWLFDAHTKAKIRYKGTRVSMWSDSEYNYVNTSYYSIVRGGDIAFSNVPVDGSSKMPDELMESIEPFDLSEAVDFQTAYLSGYFADKYDVGSEETVERANERIQVSCEQAFANTVDGFQSVTAEGGNINISNGKAKYAFLPVWLLNTTWQGKAYTFAMNAQTGKMVGDLPVDKGAAWRFFFIACVVASAVAFAAQYLFWLL